MPRASTAGSDPSRSRRRALKILLADDHPLFREGVRAILGRLAERLTVVEASDFNEAVELGRKHRDLDLILLDLSMPGAGALDGLKALRHRLPAVPIVVVTASESRNDAVRCLECGAAGYIPKSSTGEAMLAALEQVLAGGIYAPSLLLRPVSAGAPGSVPVTARTIDDIVAALTPREMDVLALLARGKSNKEIAGGLGLSVATVKIHMTAILRTLGVGTRLEAVVAARGLHPRSDDATQG